MGRGDMIDVLRQWQRIQHLIPLVRSGAAMRLAMAKTGHCRLGRCSVAFRLSPDLLELATEAVYGAVGSLDQGWAVSLRMADEIETKYDAPSISLPTHEEPPGLGAADGELSQADEQLEVAQA
eukprot:SAG31_NODE_12464_length_939_cov_4.334297_1_plen_122_part_10